VARADPTIFYPDPIATTVLLLVITFGGLALHRQAMRTLVGQRDERAVTAAAKNEMNLIFVAVPVTSTGPCNWRILLLMRRLDPMAW